MDEQGGLFAQAAYQPLAERVRPRTLDDFVGQEHLLGQGKILRRLIESDRITSMIFWGPPGVGKTTLAQIIAARTKAEFITFSAVTSGIKEIRTVMQEADRRRMYGERIVVFVDEIHRFNKAQQDAFLPFVEKGSIVLIGATTENPSFEINNALLSRCRVFVLQGLTEADIERLLRHAIATDRELSQMHIHLSDDGITAVAAYQACHYIGYPECNVHLTQAVVYLSLAPKSNAMETAYLAAAADARTMLAEPVPLVIRNAPTRLMKDLDYGKGYQYAHDAEEHITNMQCLPDSLVGRAYYQPTDQGMESRFRERLEWIKAWKAEHAPKKNNG